MKTTKSTTWILSVVSDGICIVLLSFATDDLAKRFLVDQGYLDDISLLKQLGMNSECNNEYNYIEKHDKDSIYVERHIRLAEREVITEQTWL